jgi:hypothetical protein
MPAAPLRLISFVTLAVIYSANAHDQVSALRPLPTRREVIGEWLMPPRFGPFYCTLTIIKGEGGSMDTSENGICLGLG